MNNTILPVYASSSDISSEDTLHKVDKNERCSHNPASQWSAPGNGMNPSGYRRQTVSLQLRLIFFALSFTVLALWCKFRYHTVSLGLHISLAMLLLLTACSESDTSLEQSRARGSDRTAQAILTPQTNPADVIQGEALPGRLLFVQQGFVWLWKGSQAGLLFGDGVAWQPAWSPDGSQIAYIERGESYSNVKIADANGTQIEQLTFNDSDMPLQSRERICDSMWAFYPTWSPDSMQITVTSQYAPPLCPPDSPAMEYNLTLYTLQINNGNRSQIYADDDAHTGRSTYMPNGQALVFTRASREVEGVQQIYLLDRRSGSAVPFPSAPLHSYDPAFSPDGAWMFFAAKDNDRTDIWALPGLSSQNSAAAPQRLTTLGTARAPAVSPDGQKLAFLAIPEGKGGFDLWIANLSVSPTGLLQASAPRQITHDMRLDADSSLSWAP